MKSAQGAFCVGSSGSTGDTIPNCLGELGEISGENRWRVRGIRAGFPVFATCPVVISAHSQTIANQGEKKDGHREFHSPRRTSFTVSSPQPHRRFTPGPCNQDPNGAACWSLVAQAPGRKGAFVPDSSEPRRDDTKPVTTAVPLPVWGTRQGIGLSYRGDLGLAPPGYDLPPLRGSREGL